MSATFWSMMADATRSVYLTRFSCSTGSPVVSVSPPNRTHSVNPLYASTLVVAARMLRLSGRSVT